MTMQVHTRWYRAPEVMLTEGNYGAPADIWASGCVMAEMLTRTVLFKTAKASDLDLYDVPPSHPSLPRKSAEDIFHVFLFQCASRSHFFQPFFFLNRYSEFDREMLTHISRAIGLAPPDYLATLEAP